MAAPAGLPPAIHQCLVAKVKRAIGATEPAERLTGLAMDIHGAGPEAMTRAVVANTARREPLIKAAGIRAE